MEEYHIYKSVLEKELTSRIKVFSKMVPCTHSTLNIHWINSVFTELLSAT